MVSPTTAPRVDAPPSASTPRHARFEAMSARAPVSICHQACLRLRTRFAECKACVDACPTKALHAAEQSLELGPGCTGCGRCQAACPTGALALEGFDTSSPALGGRANALAIDCWRVSADLADRGGIRVPCLGGLSAGRLLGLCAAAGEATVTLVDRGWCSQCTSGGSEHPARATLDRVIALMTQASVPESRLPRLELRATRDASARRPDDDPMVDSGRARRGFFAALAKPAGDIPRHARSLRQIAPSTERARTVAALQTLVARHGGRMPAALFHRLVVSPTCRGHRVCASSCPTGALLRWRDDGSQRMGLAFDNASCIGCGHCAAVCPEQALQLRRGAGEVGRGRQPLTTFEQRECPDCGSRFATPDGEDETLCQRCRTSARLVRSASQTLFGARP